MIKENNYSNILNKKLLNFKLSKLNNDIENLKKAYPNYSDQVLVSGQYNIDKWIETLREIIHKEHSGNTFKQALDLSTESWNPIEKGDFSNWVRFYQSGNHLKYKVAQDKNWYENEEMPGYFIPVTRSANESINKDLHSNIDFASDVSHAEKIDLEKSSRSESHRKKLISRLDSLEKLLRNYEDLPGEELTSLMEAIFSLKKKIINLKKRSSVESFCKDLIIREANSLANQGSYKAASFLYVVAQEKAETSPQTTPASSAAPPSTPDANKPATPEASSATTPQSTSPSPSPAPAPPPTANVGSPASTPTSPVGSLSSSPGSPVASQPSTSTPTSPGAESVSTSGMSAPGGATPTTTTTPDPLKELEKDLGTGGLNIDINQSDDILVFDDNYLEDNSFIDDGLFVTAQDANVAPAPAPSPSVEPEAPVVKNFDDKLESLLGQVSIEDVVLKIEEICKVFKTREIPRQLAVVDMMLDRLGLASFFPSLSEATNKSLESNNYILSRIENILAQLRGAIKTRDLDLTPDSTTPAAAAQIKKNLEEREKAEQERRQIRKELEDQSLLERAKEQEAPPPELEVTDEELAPETAPPPVPAATPTPTPPPAV